MEEVINNNNNDISLSLQITVRVEDDNGDSKEVCHSAGPWNMLLRPRMGPV
jgi:hypothetical protein